MADVYITNTSSFLPNGPIANEEMETYLGMINGQISKSKRLVLRNNGIKNRYYAMDKNGKTTHTNAEMAALSIRKLFQDSPESIKNIDILSCGTSSPDQIMPSHGVMVHGYLPETRNIDVTSPAGNCCSGMHALRYAYLAIKAGEASSAVTAGSERIGKMMRHENYEEEIKKLEELETKPFIAFEKDFLRWMLSDGAASFLLKNKKNETGLSLRIDWIESISFANQEETCMYMACDKLPNGEVRSYKEYSPAELIEKSIFSMKQDVKLLGEKIVNLGIDRLTKILEKRKTDTRKINYFLPHMSSFFFESKIAERMEMNGIGIPKEKWFTNLENRGNVGAASIYMMVDELFKSGKLKVGDQILLSVPESARFSYVYSMLTVC